MDKAEKQRSAARRGSDKKWIKLDPQRPQSIWWHTDATGVGFRAAVTRRRGGVLRVRRGSDRCHSAARRIFLQASDSARWFVLDCIRQFVRDGKADPFKPRVINRFLRSLSSEHQLTLLTDMVEKWGALGGDRAMFDLLRKVTAA